LISKLAPSGASQIELGVEKHVAALSAPAADIVLEELHGIAA
jgi:hypothetical protein